MRSLVRGLHFEMSTRQPGRDVKGVIVGRYLEFRGEVWARDTNIGVIRIQLIVATIRPGSPRKEVWIKKRGKSATFNFPYLVPKSLAS